MAAAVATATEVSSPGQDVPSVFAYPNAFRSSVSFWWKNGASSGPANAESSILERGLEPHGIKLRRAEPSEPVDAAVAADEGRVATIRKVTLPGKDPKRVLNTLEMAPLQNAGSADEAMPIVCMHGYGGGNGFWFQSLAAMAATPNTRTYFLDMLGMGLSGRPRFPKIHEGDKHATKDIRARVSQAEDFFVESLEQYREQKRFDKMTLVGHSLGGYLSLAYAIRYPSRVHKLILVSPVGVPESPYLPVERDPDPDELLTQEVGGEAKDADKDEKRLPAPNAWWTKLWEANISPFALVRATSFYGPALVSRYGARRYAAFPNDVQRDLFQYLYHICRERGSGEYALAHILAPGAYARWPMVKRIAEVQCPISFIYGDNDWMNPKGGERALEILRAKPSTPANDRQKAGSRMHTNAHSGHWVFLENPDGFNKIIAAELRDAAGDWRREARPEQRL